MRRNTFNKFSIILILLVAIFTLASYAFDQLAVQIEDKIRKTQIKIDNRKIDLYKFSILKLDISRINENSKLIVKNSLKYRNLWIKSLLINELYKEEDLKKFFRDFEYSKDQVIKSQLIDICIEKMNDNWNLLNKLYLMKGRNEFLFKNVSYDELDELYGVEETLERNKEKLKIKNFNYYDLLMKGYWKGENRMKALNNFTLDHWLDIHFLTIKLIENIDLGSEKIIETSLKKLDDAEKETKSIKKNLNSNLKEIIANKNQYILLSIISQILSLLFLLIFFRDIIINHKL